MAKKERTVLETDPPKKNGTEKHAETSNPNSPENAVVTPEAAVAAAAAANIPPARLTTNNLISAILAGYGDKATEQTKNEGNDTISKYLLQVANDFPCCSKYNIVCLYDDGTLIKSDADRIYNTVTKFTEMRPLLLMLYSNGGSAGSAYLIGKLCREYSNNKFFVTVPRMAKSAATLICCAANEIHMGSLSELGPIDPQIKELPALGLKNSVDHIAELVKKYPAASEMFAKYLNLSLELINLGYYERVAESAMQYAEKLLATHADRLPKSPKEIAYELVYKYKDHTFVIDKSEAEEIFGNKIIKKNSEEYELGNSLYRSFDFISTIAGFVNHNFYFIGSLDTPGVFTKRQPRT
ncbi:MAG TPA: hypothetical protein VJY62_07635 [Bacteroidia bacterium]|nr:hypothetical protein [Bacteroidia bacterium]